MVAAILDIIGALTADRSDQAFSPEVITAIAAVVVAVLALMVSLWQGWISREHNRKSVRPILRFDRNGLSDQPISVTLANVGPGPALIRSFSVAASAQGGDSSQASSVHPRPALQALEEVGLATSARVAVRIRTLKRGDTIRGGETVEVLSWPGYSDGTDESARSRRNELKRTLNKLTFSVVYASIYDQEWPERNSDQFAVGDEARADA